MKNSIKKHLISISQILAIFLMALPSTLLINGCQGNVGVVPSLSSKNEIPQEVSDTSIPSEIILFCGDPGVGKSSLCNSIFQQPIFKSGISEGMGMTREKQEYVYEGRKYIDTPGLSDVKLREQAAKEIEKALKENNNYKIVFVAMLNNGRIRASDLTTINTVCDAIKTPFEYGIIFNQVPTKDTKKISLEGLGKYLTDLHKQPLSTIIITRDEKIEGEENVFLLSGSENRTKLVNFIAGLKANMIGDKQVQNIDVKGYEKRFEEMELKLSDILAKLRIQQEESEKLKKENERLRQLEIQRQQEAEKQKQLEIQRQQEEIRRKAAADIQQQEANKKEQEKKQKSKEEEQTSSTQATYSQVPKCSYTGDHQYMECGPFGHCCIYCNKQAPRGVTLYDKGGYVVRHGNNQNPDSCHMQ